MRIHHHWQSCLSIAVLEEITNILQELERKPQRIVESVTTNAYAGNLDCSCTKVCELSDKTDLLFEERCLPVVQPQLDHLK